MKSERWQSSKSILLSFQDFKDELKTERQWAKAGYLPVSEDCGKKLRPSRFSTGSVSTLPRYLLPEEVRAASSDELAEYFKPERERKAAQAAKRRAKLSPLEDDSLSLNAQYVFCCLVLNDGSLVVDHPIIAAGLDELIRHGYLSNEGDIDAAKDIQQTFSRFNGTEWQETD